MRRDHFAALCLLPLFPPCGGARSGAPEGDPLVPVPECRFPPLTAADTAGWREPPGGPGPLLPPGYRRDTTVWFRHGGRQWGDGARTLAIYGNGGAWADAVPAPSLAPRSRVAAGEVCQMTWGGGGGLVRQHAAQGELAFHVSVVWGAGGMGSTISWRGPVVEGPGTFLTVLRLLLREPSPAPDTA